MTKINQTNETTEPQENIFISERENYVFSKNNLALKAKNKSHRWKHALPDLPKQCLICDSEFTIKYNLPRQKYSQKNNWGYWTKKEADQNKYLCNTCLWKLHVGKMSDWIENESRADVFYNYIKKGQFGPKEF